MCAKMDKENQMQQILGRKTLFEEENSIPRTPLGAINRETLPAGKTSSLIQKFPVTSESGQTYHSIRQEYVSPQHFGGIMMTDAVSNLTPDKKPGLRYREKSLLKQIAQPSLDNKLTECEEKPLQQSDSETIEAITSIEIFTDNPTISEVTTVQSERPPRQNLILAEVDVNAGHGSITEPLEASLSCSIRKSPVIQRPTSLSQNFSSCTEEDASLDHDSLEPSGISTLFSTCSNHSIVLSEQTENNISNTCASIQVDQNLIVSEFSKCKMREDAIQSCSIPEKECYRSEEISTQEAFQYISEVHLSAADDHMNSCVSQKQNFTQDTVNRSENKSCKKCSKNTPVHATNPASLHVAEYSKSLAGYDSYQKKMTPSNSVNIEETFTNSDVFPNSTASLTDVTSFISDVETDKENSFNSSRNLRFTTESLGSCGPDTDLSFNTSLPTEPSPYGMRHNKQNILDESLGFAMSYDTHFNQGDLGLETCKELEYEAALDLNETVYFDFSEQMVSYSFLSSKSLLAGQAQTINVPDMSIEIKDNSLPDDHISTHTTNTLRNKDLEILDASIKNCCLGPNSNMLFPPSHKANMLEAVKTADIATVPVIQSFREVDTMTCLVSETDSDTRVQRAVMSEIALSPLLLPVKETDTMTVPMETADTATETDLAELMDHSVLATTDVQDHSTMTDHSGCISSFTSMTPLKALVKKGKRFTTDDIRKQHPRALANHLDTLVVCNARLETEILSFKEECALLRKALREAKVTLAAQEELQAKVEKQKQQILIDSEHRLMQSRENLERLAEERLVRIKTLEEETNELKQASADMRKQHARDMEDLQEKCHALERAVTEANEQHLDEISKLKAVHGAVSYKYQFECAQRTVRKQEVELEELRSLFVDLQTTVMQQEKVHSAFQEVHTKVMHLARENTELREKLIKECLRQKREISLLEQQNSTLLSDTHQWRKQLSISNDNLIQLEKLHSSSTIDVLIATDQALQYSTELFHANKTVQEMLQSKEILTRQVSELQEELSHVRSKYACVIDSLEQTQKQLQKRDTMCEKMRQDSIKFKAFYQEKLENLELGIDNLQKTLDYRELDIDNLEKDLYECRNIIVEQRYKIDGMETKLREAQAVADQNAFERKEDVEYLKETNAFLEAERSVYMESLRDLQEKLKVAFQENTQNQELAKESKKIALQFKEEKENLMSQLTALQKHMDQMSSSLALEEAKHGKATLTALRASKHLLENMQAMLCSLKKKTGLEVTLEPSTQNSFSSYRKDARKKRTVRKSFVTKILGAAMSQGPAVSGVLNTQEDSTTSSSAPYESDCSNSDVKDVAAIMNGSGDATGTGVGAFAHFESSPEGKSAQLSTRFASGSECPRDSKFQNGKGNENDLTADECIAVHDLRNTLSAPMMKSSLSKLATDSFMSSMPQVSFMPGTATPRLVPSHSSAFTLVKTSATPGPSHSTHSHLQDAIVPSSGFAQIRAIPRTERCSLQTTQPKFEAENEIVDIKVDEESGILSCLAELEDAFTQITRLSSIIERASQLSLQDLKEENDMLQERINILQKDLEMSHAEVCHYHHESKKMEGTIRQLQEHKRQLAEHMMSLTDQKFEIRRLADEVKRLEGQLEKEELEKKTVSLELENLLKQLETPNSSFTAGAVEAGSVREIIALRRKNQQLMLRLGEQRDHYEELGAKASRRMRVLEDNWRKAEDEVYRFDELVDKIRQIAETGIGTSSSSDLSRIVNLICNDNDSLEGKH